VDVLAKDPRSFSSLVSAPKAARATSERDSWWSNVHANTEKPFIFEHMTECSLTGIRYKV